MEHMPVHHMPVYQMPGLFRTGLHAHHIPTARDVYPIMRCAVSALPEALRLSHHGIIRSSELDPSLRKCPRDKYEPSMTSMEHLELI